MCVRRFRGQNNNLYSGAADMIRPIRTTSGGKWNTLRQSDVLRLVRLLGYRVLIRYQAGYPGREKKQVYSRLMLETVQDE